MSDDDRKKRQQIADEINAFLGTLNLTFDVKADDVEIVPAGAKVTKTWGDVAATITIGSNSLGHLSMAMGFLDAFSGRRGPM